LIFDSVYNSFRGVIAYYKIMNGTVRKGDLVKFYHTDNIYTADEIGILQINMIPKKEMSAGDVGYMITGIKNSKEVKVGDTITHKDVQCKEAIHGFEDVKPMVYAGIYPIENEDFENLRDSLEKLQLNDSSLTFEPESSAALGFGFRCGFLGMLHLEIIQERLSREFDMEVITTIPNVSYFAYTTKGVKMSLLTPADFPDPTHLDRVEEPYINAQIITKPEYFGSIMTLCLEKRGEFKSQNYLTPTRVEMIFELPLAEIVFDFYDRLKSISRGYASFDYTPIGYRASDLVKVDIKLNSENVDALSALVHRDKAYAFGRRICEKLKTLLPKQMFVIAIQASIGAKIIARETISAMRKDVTAKCYGGDITRKRKLLEKQKKGKKKMRQIGSVEVPQKAFLDVLKLD
jgi:GTP-binding protein LepA